MPHLASKVQCIRHFSAILTAKIVLALPKSFLAVLVTYFITRAMPMHYIDGEGHKSETKKQQELSLPEMKSPFCMFY